MLKTKHLLFIFIPALILAAFALFIRLVQYEPLIPKEEAAAENKTGQKEAFIIPVFPDDPIIGSKKAGLTLIAFEDFGCEGCKSQMAVLDKLLEKYPSRVKIIWKGLPVTQFPYPTDLAHEYAYCANQQNKFADFKRLAFANSGNLKPEILKLIAEDLKINDKKLAGCLASPAPKTYRDNVEQLARALNIQAVPTVFWNNKQIEAPQLLEGWETLLAL